MLKNYRGTIKPQNSLSQNPLFLEHTYIIVHIFFNFSILKNLIKNNISSNISFKYDVFFYFIFLLLGYSDCVINKN